MDLLCSALLCSFGIFSWLLSFTLSSSAQVFSYPLFPFLFVFPLWHLFCASFLFAVFSFLAFSSHLFSSLPVSSLLISSLPSSSRRHPPMEVLTLIYTSSLPASQVILPLFQVCFAQQWFCKELACNALSGNFSERLWSA